MADRRKLQKEIDMCIKKIVEGVEEFDDVFEKLNASSQQNQKEKKEEELKKIIKKLQRNRDQIKAWQQSNEVKDKEPLRKYRQLIERQMERFKIIERETKTKAFSKIGLEMPSSKVDPAQREKDDCRKWLHDTIDKLQQQKEQCEASIDQLQSGKRKKISRADQEQIDDLQVKLDRHLYYTTNLETLMRLLDNDQIPPRRINEVRDHVEYYVDNNDEDESLYMDEPDLFSDFDLEEVKEVLGITKANEPVFESAKSDTSSDKGSKHSSKEKELEKQQSLEPEPVENHVEKKDDFDDSDLRKRNKSSGSVSEGMKVASEVSSDSPQRRQTSRPPNFPGLPASSTPAKATATPVNFAKAAAQGSAIPAIVNEQRNRKGVWGGQTEKVSTNSSLDLKDESTSNAPPTSAPLSALGSIVPPTQPHLSESTPTPAPGLQLPELSAQAVTTSQSQSAQPAGLGTPEEKKVIQPPPNLQPQSPTFDLSNHVQTGDMSSLASQFPNGIMEVVQPVKDMRVNETVECSLAELVGPTPILSKQVAAEHDQMRFAVEAAFKHFPQLSDSEKPRNYMYRQPTPYCPSYYPKTCLRDMHTPEFFTKLPQETLFYIFYYMEGTRAQYLAAWALKKNSWRFHTKYMMWFQRHEEPKVINDEYEQGTYVYFDYEKWQSRRKDGFTFEYRYLEDRELPIN